MDKVSVQAQSSPKIVNGVQIPSITKWKQKWNKYILLVQWKREGRSWSEIKEDFGRVEITTEQSSWDSTWQRAEIEIEALAMAVSTDRYYEFGRLDNLMSQKHSIVEAARIDYEDVWTRISQLMKECGSQRQWTPEKVEYIWSNGVSDMYPHLEIRQRQFNTDLRLDVCDPGEVYGEWKSPGNLGNLQS